MPVGTAFVVVAIDASEGRAVGLCIGTEPGSCRVRVKENDTKLVDLKA